MKQFKPLNNSPCLEHNHQRSVLKCCPLKVLQIASYHLSSVMSDLYHRELKLVSEVHWGYSCVNSVSLKGTVHHCKVIGLRVLQSAGLHLHFTFSVEPSVKCIGEKKLAKQHLKNSRLSSFIGSLSVCWWSSQLPRHMCASTCEKRGDYWNSMAKVIHAKRTTAWIVQASTKIPSNLVHKGRW